MNAIFTLRHGAWTIAPKLKLATLLLFLPVVSPGSGVVTECTEANLRSAMAAGGTITFACDGMILLSNPITNFFDTTLDASGRQITISGGSAVRMFYVITNVQFNLLHLTLADGHDLAGAAILNAGGRVHLNRVGLQTNQASSGGAINNLGGIVTATDCIFAGNRALSVHATGIAPGGAIVNAGGEVAVERCSFVGNSAIGGLNPQPVGMAGYGGAVFNDGTLSAVDCTFNGNFAAGAPGCFWGDSGGDALGGAIYNSSSVMINRCTFASNSATGGDGLTGSSGGVVFEQGLPGQNGGSGGNGSGGALFNNGVATLINCTVAGNIGWGGNGANGGNGGGGAVHWGGNGGNGGSGGDGYGGIAGTCQLTNCTLAWNTGHEGTASAGGAGGSGVYPGLPGAPGSAGNSVGTSLGSIAANILSTANHPGGSDTITNAMLGSLDNYGGSTLTIDLLPESPAIDAGNNSLAPPVDQRHIARPFGAAADLGAYEYATLLQIRRGAANGVELVVLDAFPGQPCRLLTATAFADWSCIGTNWVEASGKTIFQQGCDVAEPQRFFKVAIPSITAWF